MGAVLDVLYVIPLQLVHLFLQHTLMFTRCESISDSFTDSFFVCSNKSRGLSSRLRHTHCAFHLIFYTYITISIRFTFFTNSLLQHSNQPLKEKIFLKASWQNNQLPVFLIVLKDYNKILIVESQVLLRKVFSWMSVRTT